MKQITTSVGFQDAKGTVVALGTLRLQLSQNAEISSGGGQVTAQPIFLPLDANGKITATNIFFNDELSPASTVYSAQLFGSNGCLLITDYGYWSITGASADLSTMVPAVLGVSYSGAVLLAPTGNQTIATNDLLPGTTATQNLGSAAKLWNAFLSAMQAVTGTITTLTVTTINKLTLTQPATGSTLTVPDGTTQTFPSTSQTLVGRTSTDTMTGKTLQGAGSGNAVTLLNSQDTLGNITGNGTDQTVYTFTIPANTVQAGKGIRLTFGAANNNAAAVTYKFTLGTTTALTLVTAGAAQGNTAIIEIFNNSGVQTAQVWTERFFDGATILSNNFVTSAENMANALALKVTASEVNPNTITPKKWFVELIQ